MHIFADDGQTTNNNFYRGGLARGERAWQKAEKSQLNHIMAVSIGLSRSMLMPLHMLL